MGTVEIELAPLPRAGERLPNFRFQSIDGQQRQSSELLGEIVLIDFWATWCNPCVALLPKMKEIHETFESTDRFRLLGLNLDTELEIARDFISERDLSWDQGFLGDQSGSQKSLGIGSVPHYCLVDADGTILEWGSDLEKIQTRIKALLKSN